MGAGRPHIVIVGAGMVGMSMALQLARYADAPWSVTLVDASPLMAHEPLAQPSFDARSTALSPSSIHTFQTLGCWQSLAAHVTPIQAVQVSDRGYFAGLTLSAPGVDTVGGVIENRHLGQVLYAQLQRTNVVSMAPAQVQQCQPKAGGYQLLLAVAGGRRTLEADLLLIADGAQSTLRAALGIQTSVYDYQQVAWVMNVALSKPHRGIAHERFTSRGPIALLPLANQHHLHRAALVWTMPRAQRDAFAQSSPAVRIARLHRAFGYRAGAIHRMGEAVCYPLQQVFAEEQVRSHMVLLGNAAHLLHPVAGQGFNLALREVSMLADSLWQATCTGEDVGQYATLRRYQERQRSDQAMTMALTHHMVRCFSSDQWAVSLLRQWGLMGLNLFPVAKHMLARRMMGLSL